MRPKNKIPELSEKDKIRFWGKVAIAANPNDCWEWQRPLSLDGYGNFDLSGNTYRAHRVAYFLVNGDPGNFHCCHKCDNRKCVNPIHIFLGDDADNIRDMHLKGRAFIRCGEDNNKSVFKDSDIFKIRNMYAEGGYTIAQLARAYNCDASVIGAVVANKTWKHLDPNYIKPKVKDGNHKLSPEDVFSIIEKYKNGDKGSALAKEYSITYSMVYSIVKGKCWKHISKSIKAA